MNWLVTTLIDFLILGAYLYYFIFIWEIYPFSIGGTLVFTSIIGIGFYFSFIRKEFSETLTTVSLLLCALMGLNYMAYLEYNYGFSRAILIGSSLFVLIYVAAAIHLIKIPFGSKETSRSILLRMKFSGLIGYIFVIPLMFIGITGSFFMAAKEEFAGLEHIFNFCLFSLIWVNAGLSFVLVLIHFRPIFSRYMPYIVVKRIDSDSAILRKWFYIISVLSIVVGSIFEISRDLWALWFLSWIVFNLTIILSWRVWKYVFQVDENVHIDINESEISTIPDILTPRYFIKFVVSLAAIGFCYGLILLLLLGLVGK